MTISYSAVLPRDASLPVGDEAVSDKARDELLGIAHIRDPKKLVGLTDEWHRFERCFRTPFLSYNWFTSSARAFCALERMDIVLVRSLLELKAIAPLSIRGTFWPRIEILGNHVTDEPSGFLYADRQSLAVAITAMMDMKLPAYLKGLRFGSLETKLIEETAREKNAIVLTKEEALPWVRTTGTWAEFERGISSSRRSSIRRLQRILESKGPVTYEIIAPSPETVDHLLSELYEVEGASWKGRAGTALNNYQELGAFFRLYAVGEANAGRLRLLFLRINGQAIAGQLAVVHSNRLWVFKIGHVESWSSFSPGILLMHRAMQYCYETDLDACELLGHDEPWLHIWPTEFHPTVSYKIYHRKLDALIDLVSEVLEICSYRLGKALAKQGGR